MREFEGLSQRQLAEAKGCALTTVQNWLRQGIPHRMKAGKKVFSLPEVEKWLSERGKREPGSLDAERARLAKEQADKIAMENAVSRGEYVHIEDVAAHLEAVIVALKAKIQGRGTRLATRVVGCGSIPEVKALIDGDGDELLREIAQISPGGHLGASDGAVEEVEPRAPAAAPDRKRMGRLSPEAVAGVQRRAGSVEYEPSRVSAGNP